MPMKSSEGERDREKERVVEIEDRLKHSTPDDQDESVDSPMIKMSPEQWVVAMEESLEHSITDDVDDSHDGRIHQVPKSLLKQDTEVFYLPQVVFLGPYHFIGIEKRDDEMERLKTEIARNVHLKLKKEKKKEENSAGVDESGFKSAVEIFKKQEEEIKKSYAEKFEVSGEVLAWMMARDACFVLHVLQRFGQDEASHHPLMTDIEKDMVKNETELGSISRSLSGKLYHPLMIDIEKDMLKMENQLPLWALRKISPDENEWLVSALKNLSPINVPNVRKCGEYKDGTHILQLLRDIMVDSKKSSACSCCFRCSPWCILSCVCAWFLMTCFEVEWTIILIVFFPVLLILFLIFVVCDAPLEWENVPTVEELKKLGVKFERLKRLKRGISHIMFKSSTLYLPQFKVDNRSEVILRNLIALEMCSKENEKPITSYALMMNDLINTKEDVAILRRADIIINKLGSDEEVANLWNSFVPSTKKPSYPPIDKAVSGIDRYRKRKWKILWAQFVMTYCSKPWLFLSVLTAILVLLFTFLQTVCQFAKCQDK